MANKIGPKIKEARTAAGLSQTALAEYVDGVSGSDIGKAERGEKELTQAQLKQIAKATGVTQKSLLEAAEASTYKKATASTAKKTTGSSTAKKTTTSTAKKTTSSTAKKDELTLTATEKKLVELYRAADSDTKKSVMATLKGEDVDTGILGSLLGGSGKKGGGLGGILGGLLGDE